MKAQISLLGIIEAFFGFISAAVPWLFVTIYIPIIGTIDIVISLTPYKFLIWEFFSDLIIAQILIIIGSILTLIFIHKVESRNGNMFYFKLRCTWNS